MGRPTRADSRERARRQTRGRAGAGHARLLQHRRMPAQHRHPERAAPSHSRSASRSTSRTCWPQLLAIALVLEPVAAASLAALCVAHRCVSGQHLALQWLVATRRAALIAALVAWRVAVAAMRSSSTQTRRAAAGFWSVTRRCAAALIDRRAVGYFRSARPARCRRRSPRRGCRRCRRASGRISCSTASTPCWR